MTPGLPVGGLWRPLRGRPPDPCCTRITSPGGASTPNPAREDRRDYSADLSRIETTDAIRQLLDLLGAALVRPGAIRILFFCLWSTRRHLRPEQFGAVLGPEGMLSLVLAFADVMHGRNTIRVNAFAGPGWAGRGPDARAAAFRPGPPRAALRLDAALMELKEERETDLLAPACSSEFEKTTPDGPARLITSICELIYV